ncbi:14316_t:CDS:1 [Ambispora leptoticha]|uniref:14316_t:CDS:1 n=1 Tax=Ambispora leptoticha TaxID=144679 RepID=A0A9N9AGX2_9GLOM|nr:14316_t:CDS:1 [Ambispora leptoticha]
MSQNHPFLGSVSYKNEKPNTININKNLRVKIEKMNQDIAKMYFANNHDVPIPIPNGFVCMCTTNDEEIIPSADSYLITWSSSYALFLNGEEVFKLVHKQQSIVKGEYLLK